MAECPGCERDMFATSSCAIETVVIDGTEFRRIPYGFEAYVDMGANSEGRCYDCNAIRGGYHHTHCDVEQCPACREQLLSCICDYEHDVAFPQPEGGVWARIGLA